VPGGFRRRRPGERADAAAASPAASDAQAEAVRLQGPEGDDRAAKTTSGFQKFVVRAGPRYGQGRRGGSGERLLRLELNRVCKSKRIDQVFVIAFSRSGAVDRRLSDLNANGIDDRRDR
jgi:hypothetical protein